MAECYNVACPYCVGYQCRRTCTCDMRLNGEYVKVKHGRWKKDGEIMMFGDIPVKCTQCGFKTLQDASHRMDYHYCPNCGAKMDGVETYTINAGEV